MLALFLAASGGGAASAGILIKIDKAAQRMTVAVDGTQRYDWKVSTGKSGYTTPSGTFRPFRLEPDHYSTEWDNAPMPHSIFFTPRGHAIHGSYQTRRLGRAVSHGCVRLAPENAAALYSLVSKKGLGSTTIVIAGGLGAEEIAPVDKPAKKTIVKTKRHHGDWLQQTWRRR